MVKTAGKILSFGYRYQDRGALRMQKSTPSAVTEGRHLLYVADPLCSWCYGFAPIIETISRHFEGRMGLRLIMGGLRAGNTKPMRTEDKTYIRDAWTRVAAASGQQFDHAFFGREGFVYDTEPACRAVVTVREWVEGAAMSPLAFKARISEAFYRYNRDVTDPDVIAVIAGEAGFDPSAFKTRFLSEHVRSSTFRDFLTSQEMGVRGFPMLAAGSEGTGYALVTNGFRPIDGLVEALESWIAQGAPITKSG
jgi:putative protein-disulfide isomerase